MESEPHGSSCASQRSVTELTAAQVMTRNPVTVGLDTTLREVRAIFERVRTHHVPVVEDGRLFGVIAERDVLLALSPHLATPSETPRDTATLTKKAHQVMARRPIVARPDTPISEIAAVFRGGGIGSVPVVTEDWDLIGIVTWRDLIAAAFPAS